MNMYSFSKPERRYQVDGFDTTIIQVNDKTRMDEHGHYRSKDTLIIKPIKRWVIEPAEYATESAAILTYNPNALWYLLINSVKELDSLRQSDKAEFEKLKEQQESQKQEQKSTIDSLKIIISNHENRITRLESKNSINSNNIADIILEQNNPNPFSDNTTITYFIPGTLDGDPILTISPYSRNEVLKQYGLQKGIPTQQIILADDLDTGVYVYSIVILNQVVASKKFIIIK